MARATTRELELETWRNSSLGRLVLFRLDSRGHPVEELVGGHKSFQISPQERRYNQDKAYSPEVDAFSNGQCVPVRLIDGEEDVEKIRTNPNLLTDDDLKGLFAAKGDEFVERISGISNPGTIQRLIDMSYDQDASLRQVEALKARLAEAAPAATSAPINEKTEAHRQRKQDELGVRAVTPR